MISKLSSVVKSSTRITEKMKAVRIHATGGVDVLQYEDVDIPVISNPNEILIKNAVIGTNYIDIYSRTGLYPPKLPTILGRDGSGVVEAIGSEVKNLKVGDRVAYPSPTSGGSYAEYCVASSNFVCKLPEDISHETATCLMVSGLTAQYLSRSSYPIQKGDTLLVHAAAGALGQLLSQVAKHLGAIVIGTTSSPEKAEIAKSCGCDHVILYTKDDFVAETLKLTNGKGVNAIYDSVGLSTFEKGFGCLAKRGTMVLCGNSSGKPTNLDISLIANGSKTFTRASMIDFLQTPEEFSERMKEVLKWTREGVIKPNVWKTLPLSQVKEAHKLLESRQTVGKILLTP